MSELAIQGTETEIRLWDGTKERAIRFRINGQDVLSEVVVLAVRGVQATITEVAYSATNVTLLAANTGRMGLNIDNNASTELFVKFGATASSSSFTKRIPPYTTWEHREPVFQGQIDGIWTSGGSGSAVITELT